MHSSLTAVSFHQDVNSNDCMMQEEETQLVFQKALRKTPRAHTQSDVSRYSSTPPPPASARSAPPHHGPLHQSIASLSRSLISPDQLTLATSQISNAHVLENYGAASWKTQPFSHFITTAIQLQPPPLLGTHCDARLQPGGGFWQTSRFCKVDM